MPEQGYRIAPVRLTANNLGINGNIANNETFAAGTTSNICDISAFNHLTLLYEDAATSTLDTLDVEISGNSAKYYKIATLTPAVRGLKREAALQLDVRGITNIRVKNASAGSNYTSVTCSAYGTA